MVKVDFHVHTTSSDGLLSPEEVVLRAHANGVSHLSITDHDTISAIDEAKTLSKKLGINFIPGIELSTNHNGESIHLLGFFKDDSYKTPEFSNYLYTLKNQRKIRAEKMVSKLNEIFNINISLENVLHRGKDVVARPHIAQEIISCGYPYELEYIFQNFIGKGCPCYVPANKLSTEDGIKLLKHYNALAILAHPVLIEKSNLDDFSNIGLDGIEAIYYQNSAEDEARFLSFSKENNLLVTAGSDSHGNLIEDTRHGDIGEMILPSEYLDRLLNALS